MIQEEPNRLKSKSGFVELLKFLARSILVKRGRRPSVVFDFALSSQELTNSGEIKFRVEFSTIIFSLLYEDILVFYTKPSSSTDIRSYSRLQM